MLFNIPLKVGFLERKAYLCFQQLNRIHNNLRNPKIHKLTYYSKLLHYVRRQPTLTNK